MTLRNVFNEVIVMAASNRRDLELELEKVANNIDKLTFDIKHHILTFFGNKRF
jgi:hypothetical protein